MSMKHKVSSRFRRLTDSEIEAYDLVPAWVAQQALLVRIPGLPGGYRGMTLSRLVLLTTDFDTADASQLVAHELVHVRQYIQYGKLGFARRYLGEFFTTLTQTRHWMTAYRSISLEKEAYELADQWAQRRSSQ